VTTLTQTRPTINVLVRDEYTLKEESSYSLKKPLILSFVGKDQNLQTEVDFLEASLKLKINELVQDLYRIAVVVYVWDLQIQRRAYEPRYFSILISVSDKEKWDNVKNHLEGTLRFLTGDTYDFHFIQGKRSGDKFKFEKKSEKSVLLFSGGLDSLAGFKWMVDQNSKPLLVSHPAMGLISGVQKDLVSRLKNIVGKNSFEWYQFRAGPKPKSKLTEKETTQFSRSFLYLTMGATVALSLGINEEFVCENGILALNIPLTQSRIYSNTRTVHPRFLVMYQELLDSVFGHCLSIKNPFSTMTKGEVVKLLDADKYRDLVKISISCPNVTPLRWKGVETSKIRHCGICLPCIVRRVAIHYANLSDNDALYQNDITGSYAQIPEDGKKMLLEMMDFARQIETFSNVNEAFLEFPQFYVGETVNPDALFDMVRRQVTQFNDFLKRKADQSIRQSLHMP
jgi:7-cyano-7-deazaguanine synthase in queuosine biosynthesis